VAVALDHLKRNQKQDNAARDLKRAGGHADLFEHELARKKKEDQYDKCDQHRIQRQPALRCAVAPCGQHQKRWQHTEWIDDQEQRHKLAEMPLPPHAVPQSPARC
jgi:hypothetical protein